MSFPLADTAHLTRSYAGVLDDVMVRYGKGREFLTPAFFNKMILKNVIFGSGLFLNDGYLVNHAIARASLANPESLLSHMISTGFIRILSREPDADRLSAMPEKMADDGNHSFEILIASDEWQETVRPAFRRVARAVFQTNTVRPWPRFSMTEGFCKMIDRVRGTPPANIGCYLTTADDLARLFDEFDTREPWKGNARDKFEKAALAVNEGRDDMDARMAEVMEIANQAYHYNFGMTLNAEEDAPVAADTTVGLAFDELLKTTRIERAQLESIPLIQFPETLPLDAGSLFLPFIRADHPVSEAKQVYMSTLSRLVSEGATNIPALRQDASEATRQYIARMKEYFAQEFGNTTIDMAFDGVADFGLTRDSVVATAAPSAHLAVALHRAASAERRQFLLEQFEIVDATDAYDGEVDKNTTIRIGDIRAQLSSIAFDSGEAERFTEDLTVFAVD